jgi:hypothetical protein
MLNIQALDFIGQREFKITVYGNLFDKILYIHKIVYNSTITLDKALSFRENIK